jgi:hypothetical protein
MKNKITSSLLTLTVTVALSAFALAQRPSSAGGGRPSGVGGGNMSPGNPNMGSSGRAGEMSNERMGHTSMGGQAPGSVLDNPKLATSLSNALSKSGVTIPGGNLQTACGGFKTLGQCVAALHVSQNLSISFTDLKNKMTGSGSEKLGTAIKDLGGPNVDAKKEAKKANKQADEDLHTAEAAS